jgi:hypothetical protein
VLLAEPHRLDISRVEKAEKRRVAGEKGITKLLANVIVLGGKIILNALECPC